MGHVPRVDKRNDGDSYPSIDPDGLPCVTHANLDNLRAWGPFLVPIDLPCWDEPSDRHKV